MSGLFPGDGHRPPADAEGKKYDNNPQAIASGKLLFGQMNCSGCHSHGGGGMGLALMSGNWHYGGRIDQIYASISQGRPNGMPTWGTTLSPDMIWQLAAYVKSLPTSGSFSLESAPNP